MLEWYNLIFELGLASLVLYAIMMTLGILGGVDEIHSGGDHDLSDGHSHGTGDHEHTTGFGLRSALGLGKVPAGVVIVSFLALWGIAGLVMNFYLQAKIAGNPNWVWLSIAVALTVSLFGTGLLARGIARVLPTNESYSSSAQDLVGKTAEVLFDVTETAGTARLHDQFGNLLDLDVRAASGAGPFKRGQVVKVLSNLPGTRTFIVGAITG